MTTALAAAGAKDIDRRVRIGWQFPLYVQSTHAVGDEDDCVEAELPGMALDLGMFFLLIGTDEGSFIQEMQMT